MCLPHALLPRALRFDLFVVVFLFLLLFVYKRARWRGERRYYEWLKKEKRNIFLVFFCFFFSLEKRKLGPSSVDVFDQ